MRRRRLFGTVSRARAMRISSDLPSITRYNPLASIPLKYHFNRAEYLAVPLIVTHHWQTAPIICFLYP